MQSLHFADEILLLDLGSQDRTLNIAKQLGARINVEPFRDWLKLYLRATALARYNWVTLVAAKEIIPEELSNELRQIKQLDSNECAFTVLPRVEFQGTVLGDYAKAGSVSYKLFDKSRCQWGGGSDTPDLKVQGTVKQLKSNSFQKPYSDVLSFVTEIQNQEYKNSQLETSTSEQNPWSLFWTVFKTFYNLYITQGAKKDGKAGLIWSLGQAMRPIYKAMFNI